MSIKEETIKRIETVFMENPDTMFSLYSLSRTVEPKVNYYSLRDVVAQLEASKFIRKVKVHGNSNQYYMLVVE